jgi:hypothetical protein
MELLLSVLPADGSWITFDQFKAQAQAVGARIDLWRRGKQQGLLETRLPDGYTSASQLEIRRVV